MSPRPDRLAPITVEVDCCGVRHRITLRRGDLVLHDHDVDSERVAGILGADKPYCLRVLEAVGATDIDLTSLLGDEQHNPRRAGMQIGFHASAAPFAATTNPYVQRHLRHETLWALPAPLRHRLVLERAMALDIDDETLGTLHDLAAGSVVLDKRRFRRLASALDRAGRVRGSADDDEDKLLARFFDGYRLTEIPAQESKRRVVLNRLAREFTPGLQYPEKDVNRLLSAFHPDFAALRRYLVDEGLLEREAGIYRRPGEIG